MSVVDVAGSTAACIMAAVTGELDRTDWGITFNQVLGSGNLLVSNRVKLTLDISAIKQAE